MANIFDPTDPDSPSNRLNDRLSQVQADPMESPKAPGLRGFAPEPGLQAPAQPRFNVGGLRDYSPNLNLPERNIPLPVEPAAPAAAPFNAAGGDPLAYRQAQVRMDPMTSDGARLRDYAPDRSIPNRTPVPPTMEPPARLSAPMELPRLGGIQDGTRWTSPSGLQGPGMPGGIPPGPQVIDGQVLEESAPRPVSGPRALPASPAQTAAADSLGRVEPRLVPESPPMTPVPTESTGNGRLDARLGQVQAEPAPATDVSKLRGLEREPIPNRTGQPIESRLTGSQLPGNAPAPAPQATTSGPGSERLYQGKALESSAPPAANPVRQPSVKPEGPPRAASIQAAGAPRPAVAPTPAPTSAPAAGQSILSPNWYEGGRASGVGGLPGAQANAAANAVSAGMPSQPSPPNLSQEWPQAVKQSPPTGLPNAGTAQAVPETLPGKTTTGTKAPTAAPAPKPSAAPTSSAPATGAPAAGTPATGAQAPTGPVEPSMPATGGSRYNAPISDAEAVERAKQARAAQSAPAPKPNVVMENLDGKGPRPAGSAPAAPAASAEAKAGAEAGAKAAGAEAGTAAKGAAAAGEEAAATSKVAGVFQKAKPLLKKAPYVGAAIGAYQGLTASDKELDEFGKKIGVDTSTNGGQLVGRAAKVADSVAQATTLGLAPKAEDLAAGFTGKQYQAVRKDHPFLGGILGSAFHAADRIRDWWNAPAKPQAVAQPASKPADKPAEGQAGSTSVQQAAATESVAPAEFHDAVRWAESGGNPNAVSASGAKGEMQVMDATAVKSGFGVTPARDNSPEERARVGHDYLNALYRYYGGDMDKTLAAYNWGYKKVDQWAKDGADPAKLPAETRNYIAAVHRRMGTAVNAAAVNGQPPARTAPQYRSAVADYDNGEQYDALTQQLNASPISDLSFGGDQGVVVNYKDGSKKQFKTTAEIPEDVQAWMKLQAERDQFTPRWPVQIIAGHNRSYAVPGAPGAPYDEVPGEVFEAGKTREYQAAQAQHALDRADPLAAQRRDKIAEVEAAHRAQTGVQGIIAQDLQRRLDAEPDPEKRKAILQDAQLKDRFMTAGGGEVLGPDGLSTIKQPVQIFDKAKEKWVDPHASAAPKKPLGAAVLADLQANINNPVYVQNFEKRYGVKASDYVDAKGQLVKGYADGGTVNFDADDMAIGGIKIDQHTYPAPAEPTGAAAGPRRRKASTDPLAFNLADHGSIFDRPNDGVSMGFANGGLIGGCKKKARFAEGGLIHGPGTGTSDSVPARVAETGEPIKLSRGEFELSPAAVKAIGADKLDALVGQYHQPAERQVNAGSYIVPADVVARLGQDYFQQLEAQARGFADGGQPLDVLGGLKEAIVDPNVDDVRQGNRTLQQNFPVAYQAAQMHPAVGIPTSVLNYADAMEAGKRGAAIGAALSGIPVAERSYQLGKALTSGVRDLVRPGASFWQNTVGLGKKVAAGEATAESLEAGLAQAERMAPLPAPASPPVIGGIRLKLDPGDSIPSQ